MNNIKKIRSTFRAIQSTHSFLKLGIKSERHSEGKKLGIYFTQRYDFSSKNDDTDKDEKAWMPPSHSPITVNPKEKTKDIDIEKMLAQYGIEKEEGMEYVDLNDFDLNDLLEEEQYEAYDTGDDTLDISDDLDEDEILKLLAEMHEDEVEIESFFDAENKNGDNYADEDSLERKLQTIEKLMEEGQVDGVSRNEGEKSSSFDTYIETTNGNTPDWLKTRRASLEKNTSGAIEVKPLTLLTSKEIMDCLSGLGAVDVKLISSNLTTKYLQVAGMIIATGHNSSHLRILSNAIVRAMKQRQLAKRNVFGAKYGAEEGDDWIAIDAQNYAIHIMDKLTRKSINLEKLWMDEGDDEIRKIDLSNDDRIEEYVLKNPISGKKS